MRNRIYLDKAATTTLSPEVLQEMETCLRECYGNPSGVYGTGREAHRLLDQARKRTAAALGAKPQEIYFTSGGSESDNWAIKGGALARRNRGKHLITSAIEHHAVLHTFQWLETYGFEVTYLPVDGMGRVDPAEAEKAVRPDTTLISIMAANNEIGTIQPIPEIAKMARERDILFHTDAVQAIGAMEMNMEKLPVSMLSLSAHKFHGPKGIGAPYVRQGTVLESLIHGGSQERGRRAGTENMPGIVGLGRAIEKAAAGIPERAAKTVRLRDLLIRGIHEQIPWARLNGDPIRRLPGNVHFTFPGVDGEALLLRLDLMGIACSGGSACTSGAAEPSHVLKALGQGEELMKSGLRMTLNEENTEEEILEVIRVLLPLVNELRRE